MLKKKKLRLKFIGKMGYLRGLQTAPQSYLQRCHSKEWSQLVSLTKFSISNSETSPSGPPNVTQ